jgi:hypothetical protein
MDGPTGLEVIGHRRFDKAARFPGDPVKLSGSFGKFIYNILPNTVNKRWKFLQRK